MLMRSPEPAALLEWTLRPRPTGRRRFAFAYLVAAAGVTVAALIVGITALLGDNCATGGFGCLGLFFRGIALAAVLGLAILLGLSLLAKLGWMYFLGLMAFAPPLILVGVGLVDLGLPAMPFTLLALTGVPAVAAWFSHPRTGDGDDRYLVRRGALMVAPAALSLCVVAVV